jgi:drug/metabolite transporter (DMT)-like permease
MSNSTTRSSLLMLTASVIWGTAFVAQKSSLAVIGPLFYTGIRFVLGALVVALAILLGGRLGVARKFETSGAMKSYALLLGALLAASISLQQIGLETTSLANAGFISSLYVIFVPLLGLLGRKPLGKGIWIGAALALFGMYLLSVEGRFQVADGDWYQLAGALLISFQIVVLGAAARRHDPLLLACLQFLACGVICLVVAAFNEPISLRAIGNASGAILYGGVLSVGVGYTLQAVAQRDALPSHAAIIFSMEGVFAALAGWLMLDESLTARAVAGCALMFAGLVASQITNRQTPR